MSGIIRKFDVSTYSSTTVYDKYDVVKVAVGNYYYYYVSAQNSNRANLNTGNYASNNWWKRFDDYDVDFSTVWTPSFTTTVGAEPRVINSSLDDGVTQIVPDGINYHMIKLNLVFDSVSNKEAKSLLCFADFLGASKAFKMTPPQPYDKLLTFQINSCTHQYQKHNVNNVTIEIERSYMIFGGGAGQSKVGTY